MNRRVRIVKKADKVASGILVLAQHQAELNKFGKMILERDKSLATIRRVAEKVSNQNAAYLETIDRQDKQLCNFRDTIYKLNQQIRQLEKGVKQPDYSKSSTYKSGHAKRVKEMKAYAKKNCK